MDRRFADLFLASFTALFFELLLVRWLPTEIYLLGYFKNCILLATFVGFGVGCATRYDCARVLPFYAVTIALVVAAVQAVERHVSLVPWENGEFLWPGDLKESPVQMSVITLMAAVFATAATLTLPLGRLVGRYLGAYRPVVAYSVNLSASLLGVITFVSLSFLQLGPVVWFLVALLPLVYFVRSRPAAVVCHLVGVALTTGLLQHGRTNDEYWSPYSKITLSEASSTLHTRVLSTNNSGHQVLYDLSPELLRARPDPTSPAWRFIDDHAAEYDSAYAVIRPKSVLIIGGGTGNEAAAALRHGTDRVDVVEIDPVIISLGRRYHPEQPYADSRVNLITDDARHFMATTDERYDLVIFGFLDSKSHLSSMANIRLDNYVYTRESFARARRLLTPSGVLQVTYYALSDFVRLRIYLMLENAFGRPPLMYGLADGAYPDFIYFAGPGVDQGAPEPPGLRRFTYRREADPAELDAFFSSDDWPYLNLPARAIGRDYLKGLAVMAAISFAFVYGMLWRDGVRWRSAATAAPLFLQGAAFMLLETNTIMRMTLVLGSTWIVTSVAVALVLAGALLANAVVAASPRPSVETSLVFVCAALLLNYWIGVHFYLELPDPLRSLGAGLQVYLPIFGASLVFARLFSTSQESSFDFGVNILGAMFGGMLEYSSLAIGVRAVYLIALVLFLVLALVRQLERD